MNKPNKLLPYRSQGPLGVCPGSALVVECSYTQLMNSNYLSLVIGEGGKECDRSLASKEDKGARKL